MPNSLSSDQLRTLAREGARVRLQELRGEIAALESLIRDSGTGHGAAAQPTRQRRRRRRLSAAGRAAIAAGQQARWQKAKAAKNGDRAAEMGAINLTREQPEPDR